MNPLNTRLDAFARLLKIMDELREQCPWDKKQTIDSLRHLTIEETYELSEAILSGDLEEVKKELGDLMLHIVFYSRIASESQAFDVADVLHSVCDKLIRRHPHIYGDTKADTEDQVKQNWEKIKLAEGNKSVLGGVPASLPALLKAYRMQEKAKGVGFDWAQGDASPVWAKIHEELDEIKEHLDDKAMPTNTALATDELGDALFALVNYARYVGINPETALERSNQKFLRRFAYIEARAQLSGKSLAEMSLQEMDSLWNEAKTLEPTTTAHHHTPSNSPSI